jgi:hypothetical protein
MADTFGCLSALISRFQICPTQDSDALPASAEIWRGHLPCYRWVRVLKLPLARPSQGPGFRIWLLLFSQHAADAAGGSAVSFWLDHSNRHEIVLVLDILARHESTRVLFGQFEWPWSNACFCQWKLYFQFTMARNTGTNQVRECCKPASNLI